LLGFDAPTQHETYAVPVLEPLNSQHSDIQTLEAGAMVPSRPFRRLDGRPICSTQRCNDHAIIKLAKTRCFTECEITIFREFAEICDPRAAPSAAGRAPDQGRLYCSLRIFSVRIL